MTMSKKKKERPKIIKLRGGRPPKIHQDESQYNRRRDKKQQEKDACLER